MGAGQTGTYLQMDATFPTLYKFDVLVVRSPDSVCYVSRHELHAALSKHGDLWPKFIEAYPKEQGNYTANGDFLANCAEWALSQADSGQ